VPATNGMPSIMTLASVMRIEPFTLLSLEVIVLLSTVGRNSEAYCAEWERLNMEVFTSLHTAQCPLVIALRGLFNFSYPQYLRPGEFPKDIFSMPARRRSGAGLVQQTVQIVDRFALTI
jgi:hypothetical protein